MSKKRPLTLILAAPRGFCAGVDRAVQIVERALEKYGAPVYVRHEIVHNRFVVARLEARGAIFVEELSQVPNDALVIFSAHGVPKSVYAEAKSRHLIWLDATCPLVSKVHIEASNHAKQGREILLIGHAEHPEVIGTMGQLPQGAITLIETIEDAQTFQPKNPAKLAYITQTTLSVDDTADIINMLKTRFPNIHAPHKEDICYATTNRQKAVKAITEQAEALYVIGAANSSNSMRLVEVGERAGCKPSRLITGAQDIDPDELDGINIIGLTAGASAPETLVENVIERLADCFELSVEEKTVAQETVEFKLPLELQNEPASTV
ncbi:MAG: 4-hydroxy-3-methylbut-2-enyl diphosphate reductase [Alphaproteobacteria bacterium]|nr:4-hydroxy-3-methylbut-2-enyl diphosphate reductase [Alphaproteobacteria bacterium]